MNRVLKMSSSAAFLAAALAVGMLVPAADAGPNPDDWDRVVDKAIAYLRSTQADDGSWSKEKSPGVTGVILTGLLDTGKVSPNGILLLGPRVGYSVDEWLPWVRVGGAFTSGSHDAQLTYTPAAGSLAPAESFTGSKNVQNHGFNVGLGVDYGVQGPWSFVAEYNYVKLSKGSNSDVNCTSTGLKGSALCANYGQFDLSNIHNSFTMNMFRVGFHYRFYPRRSASQEQL